MDLSSSVSQYHNILPENCFDMYATLVDYVIHSFRWNRFIFEYTNAFDTCIPRFDYTNICYSIFTNMSISNNNKSLDKYILRELQLYSTAQTCVYIVATEWTYVRSVLCTL